MIIKRLFAYLKPDWKLLVFAFLLLLIATTADILGPILIKVFIDSYLTPRIFAAKPLLTLGIGYLSLTLLSVILHYFQLVQFNKIALRVIQQLRIDVFSKVQTLGLTFFDTTPAGSLLSRITNDTEAIKELFISVLSTFVQNAVFLVGIFVALFSLNVKLAAFCLIILPLIFLLMVIYRRLSAKVYRVLREDLAKLNAKLNESIQGMNIVQAMGQEKRLRREFAAINERYYQGALRNIRLDSLLVRPAVDLVYTLALALTLGFFGFKSLAVPIQIGTLYAFINYLDRFFEPVNMIMQRLSQLQQALISAERVFQLLDDQRTAPAPSGNHNPAIRHGMVEFHGVSFSYDGKTDVLKNISFTAKPGQTVALVGHTGSGKSTITNLLLRFYPVTRGEIRIDGAPLAAFTESELREKLGLVLQDPFIFAGDISQNIRLYNPRLSAQDIRDAAHFVQADSFIEKLPGQYAERLGERGATISSGQRQLLCFARTIARKPKILVLDEATASIDTETEEAIQEALNKMRRGRTTIAIAHRLSTVQDADQILVLNRGEIVERGTHQDLLAKRGLYYRMYLLQQGGNPA